MSKTQAKKIATQFLNKHPTGHKSIQTLKGKNITIYCINKTYPKHNIEAYSVADLFQQLEDSLANSLKTRSLTQNQ